MRREKINIRKKKNKSKSKIRNVKITFKKEGGKKNRTKRKIKKTLRNLKRMKRKEIMGELKRNKINAHRGSPTSILRDILFYKKTTGLNIIKEY